MTADDLREGDPYELQDGRLLECLPSGPRHGRGTLDGGAVLSSDPAVESAGVDVGFSPDPGTLRAPDIAVGPMGDGSSWEKGAPALAVEYADAGQDLADLSLKISTLLRAGTQQVWVVRLTGPRRVEVHVSGQPPRTAYPGDELTAPGILQNPVPVAALFDRSAAQEAVLRNLLNRHGYRNLEHVEAKNRAEGWEKGAAEGWEKGAVEGKAVGRAQAVLDVLSARGLAVTESQRAQVLAERDEGRLESWLRRALTALEAQELFSS